MTNNQSNGLLGKIEELQKTVWDVFEKVGRNLESIAKQQLDITKIRGSLDFIKKELARIENELKEIKRPEEPRH